MGWETLAIAGFSAMRAVNQMQQGESQANALVKQGEQEAQTSANNTVITAGKTQNSFLSSGLTLDGGPMAALTQIFNTGNTNISRIASNANNAADNAINSARTAALSTLASTAAMAAGGGGGSFFGSSESFDSLGQSVGNQFNSIGSSLGMTTRSLGPFQPYGV